MGLPVDSSALKGLPEPGFPALMRYILHVRQVRRCVPSPAALTRRPEQPGCASLFQVGLPILCASGWRMAGFGRRSQALVTYLFQAPIHETGADNGSVLRVHLMNDGFSVARGKGAYGLAPVFLKPLMPGADIGPRSLQAVSRPELGPAGSLIGNALRKPSSTFWGDEARLLRQVIGKTSAGGGAG